MLVKPARHPDHDGLDAPMLVRDPLTRQPIPQDEWTEVSDQDLYWARLARDGDVEIKPADEAEPPVDRAQPSPRTVAGTGKVSAATDTTNSDIKA